MSSSENAPICIRAIGGPHIWHPNEVCCPHCGRHFFDPVAESARSAEFDHRHTDPFEETT